MFGSLLSSLIAKFLVGSVALASVGTGVVVTADRAEPGDFLYGLDLALEKVGIGDDGVAERIEEAQVLLESGITPEGVEFLIAAFEQLAPQIEDGELAEAYAHIAAQLQVLLAENPDLYTQEVRDRLAQLLELTAAQVDGEAVEASEFAESVGDLEEIIGTPADVDTDTTAPSTSGGSDYGTGTGSTDTTAPSTDTGTGSTDTNVQP